MTVDVERLRIQRAVTKTYPGYWAKQAYYAIMEVHRALPENTDLSARIKAVDAAYPFGQREMFPYKQWLKVRADYLMNFGYVKRSKPRVGKPREDEGLPLLIAESPLERARRRAGAK